MLNIFHYNAMRIKKSTLRKRKRHIMLCLVFLIFCLVPFKVGFLH